MPLARRAGRVLAFWRAERRTLRQGFSALLISSGGDLLAGLTLGFMTGTLERLPALIVLIPAAIGMRGNIFGALGSRLGTGIHAGLFAPSRDRKGFLGQNVSAAAVLSMTTSLFLGVAAWTVSQLLGLESISVFDFVAISIIGGTLGSIIDGTGAVTIAVLSHRRSWDLDSVSAPMVTAIGDVGTLPCLWLASFVVGLPFVTLVVAVVGGLFCLAVTVRGLRSNLPIVKRVVRQSMLILLIAGVIDVFAGTIVETRLAHFLAYPSLLVLMPLFLQNTNALSGILSARLSSKLHLGVIDPRPVPEGPAWVDVAINFTFAAVVFTFVGAGAQIMSTITGRASPGAFQMVAISFTAGMLATTISSVVAYLTAIATFRFGLDPDNFGIPISSSVMDLAGTVCLVAVILAFGVTTNG
jgi:mgtE-like transporter